MKLNIMDKIIMTVVVILIIFAGISTYKQGLLKDHTNVNRFDPMSYTESLPENIKQLSEQYNIYPELYNSDKPVFTYGYNQFSMDKNFNRTFHKKLEKELNNTEFNYKIVVFKNWKDNFDELMAQNMPNQSSESCTPKTKEEELLKETIEFSHNCIKQACIINTKANTYTLMDRDIKLIMSKLKEQNPAAN